MAKLYAELTSDKGGRIASKGGEEYITMEVYQGNKLVASIEYNAPNKQVHINIDTNEITTNVNGYIL